MVKENADGDPEISVVVPCFSNPSSLGELVDRCEAVFENQIGCSYEIIMVDDGSPGPEVWSKIQLLASRKPFVRGIRLMRNFGKAGAQLCGFRHAKGRWIVGMDDDLQHPPEEIPKLLKEKQHDIVMGRFRHRHHGLTAKAVSRVKGYCDRILIGRPKDVYVSPFRLIRREVLDAITDIRTPHPFIPALLFYVTRDVVSVDVGHAPRRHGRSTFTLGKKWKQFANLLINNSSLLLRMMALSGIGFATLSILYAGWLVIRRLALQEIVPGWTSIMVTLLLIGGMILFALGVVGEYLIRIISGLENRPAFIVRDATPAHGNEAERSADSSLG